MAGAVWFNRGTMSAPTVPPPPARTPAPAGTPAGTSAAAEPIADTPEEARSHAVSAAAPPVPPAHTVAVANFNDAAKARAVAATLAEMGVPADRVHVLDTLEDRQKLLDVYHRDRPSGHTQAGVGTAIFGTGGAVVVSLAALLLFNDAPGMQWIIITAFTAGILGACLGGAAGFFVFRPADDPQNPLDKRVASAGPAVAVQDRNGDGMVGTVPLGRVARAMVRGGGKCLYLRPAERADAHPGDTRGGDFIDAEPRSAPDGRPTAATA